MMREKNIIKIGVALAKAKIKIDKFYLVSGVDAMIRILNSRKE